MFTADYQLSDPGLEEALADQLSFRGFCGFGLDDGTPDETTLCRFRATLAQRGLAEALFVELNRQPHARPGSEGRHADRRDAGRGGGRPRRHGRRCRQ